MIPLFFQKKDMKKEIEIAGKRYPVRVTMGALVRFRQMQGKEVSEMDENSSEDVCAYVYCILVSACNADNVEFGYDFLSFCDIVDLPKINEVSQMLADTSDEKKTANL